MSWSEKWRNRAATTARIGLRMAKIAIVLAAASFLCLLLTGRALDRPTPSEDEYKAMYFEYFDTSQIERLDYVWKGAIGGVATVGKAKFRRSVKLKDILVEARIKAGRITWGTYDPTEMAQEPAATAFRDEWKWHTDGTMPSWFDFPFDRKMRTLREANEGCGGSNPRPRSETIWYIDDEQNVVYVRGNWG
jgi:hypothetical protein